MNLMRPKGRTGGQRQCEVQVEKSQWSCLPLPTPGLASQGRQGSSLGGPFNWPRGPQEQEEDWELGVRPNPEKTPG